MKYLIILLTIISIPIQASFLTIPLPLAFLIPAIISYKSRWIFVLAAIAGLILDALTFHLFGITSITYLGFLFLIMLYQQKFEIMTIPFVAITSSICSLIYLLIFHYQHVLLAALLNGSLATIIFLFIQLSQSKTQNTY